MSKSIPEMVFNMAAGLPEPLPTDPMPTLAAWLAEAEKHKRVPNPNAIALATCTADGRPSVRMVLCKGLEVGPGNVVFFTNYDSRKGDELAVNPRAACVFHFDHWERQARIEGEVERVSEAESDAYFASRALLSRVGAWASAQSRPLEKRVDLLRQVESIMERFGIGWISLTTGKPDKVIPRPAQWGGFRLRARRVELWQGVAGRLHDRAEWVRSGPDDVWHARRLQP